MGLEVWHLGCILPVFVLPLLVGHAVNLKVLPETCSWVNTVNNRDHGTPTVVHLSWLTVRVPRVVKTVGKQLVCPDYLTVYPSVAVSSMRVRGSQPFFL